MATVTCERAAPYRVTYHAAPCRESLVGVRCGGNSRQMERGAASGAHNIASSSRGHVWPHKVRSFAKRNRFFLIKYSIYTGLGIGYWLATRPRRSHVHSPLSSPLLMILALLRSWLCRCHHPLHPPPLPLLLDQLPGRDHEPTPPRVNKSFIYLLFIFFCCTLKRKHQSSLFSRTWVSGGG